MFYTVPFGVSDKSNGAPLPELIPDPWTRTTPTRAHRPSNPSPAQVESGVATLRRGQTEETSDNGSTPNLPDRRNLKRLDVKRVDVFSQLLHFVNHYDPVYHQ